MLHAIVCGLYDAQGVNTISFHSRKDSIIERLIIVQGLGSRVTDNQP